MRRFENRSALITAAASGLGLGVAQRLAREGARVVIWDRDAVLLADVLKDAAGAGLAGAEGRLHGTGHALRAAQEDRRHPP